MCNEEVTISNLHILLPFISYIYIYIYIYKKKRNGEKGGLHKRGGEKGGLEEEGGLWMAGL